MSLGEADCDAAGPPDLALMLQAMRSAKGIYVPSPFWERLAREHVTQLREHGFETFKRTINLRYFSWGLFGIFAHQIAPLAWWWLKSNRHSPAGARLATVSRDSGFFGKAGGKLYALYVALLFQRVQAEDDRNLFAICREPLIGNPILVRVADGITVTQDICNSIQEFLRATQSNPRPRHVLEIGAGYGRLATVFLAASPGTKYWIVDIPPALYVSQRYLCEVYPELKIFKFRPFERFSDVEAEVAASDICFFMNDQIEMLPAKSVDISICISNLHEMTRDQIAHYFKQIDRMTAGIFYTKQWMRSIAKENGFTIARADYPVPPHWVATFNARHPIQSWFF
jgi:putative sugar O-methyltransferase